MRTLQQSIVTTATMLIYIGVAAVVLSSFALLIQPVLRIQYNWIFELAMIAGQLIFQFPFLHGKPWSLKITYYQNMLLVSFMGAVLLIPLLLLNYFYTCSLIINISYFFAVVSLMFLEHRRRVHQLQLPWYLCYTWVLYRIIILYFII